MSIQKPATEEFGIGIEHFSLTSMAAEYPTPKGSSYLPTTTLPLPNKRLCYYMIELEPEV